MITVLVLLAVLILSSVRVSKDNSTLALSKEQTQTIKGIFVITIFLSHFCSYVFFDKWFDIPMREYCSWLGQLMVVPFFFYSGYGIFESVKKRGRFYVNSFPKKRIMKTLIHFNLALVVFLVYDFFFAPKDLFFSKIILSFVAWDSVGNSNWFIFAILCAYIFNYIGLIWGEGSLYRSLIITTFLCFVYIAIVSKFKDVYWFDTILAFPLGCFVSQHKEKIMVRRDRWLLWVVACILWLLVLFVAKRTFFSSSFANSQLALIGFMLLIVFLSMKIKFKNKILSWFGAQVFEVYILQRLPMNFGKYMHWNEQNIYLYFAFCFVVTLGLAVAFHKITGWIDSKLFKGP